MRERACLLVGWVCFASFLASLLLLFLEGEHLAGSVGYVGPCKLEGRTTFQVLGGRDLKDKLRVHATRVSLDDPSTWTRTAKISNPT